MRRRGRGRSLAAGLRLPRVRGRGEHPLRPRWAALLAVRACRHQCSLVSGTLFAGTKLPLTRWFLALQLLTQAKNNVSALELKRQLGVCYRTAWLLKHKIMEAMRLREDSRELDGRVEIDDAYLGGERWVASLAWIREQDPDHRRRADHPGRAADRRLSPAATAPAEEVAVFAALHLATSATVVSDGLWCFRAAEIVGADHERMVTGGGRQGVKLPQFRAVNTLLGNLKTAIGGTYHAFRFAKYSHRYLAEFQYRFNRRFNLRTIFGRLLQALVAAPACKERRLRVAEVYR